MTKATAVKVADERTINGVDVNTLQSTINAIQTDPEIARFRFRLQNKWVNGGHNRSMVGQFYGAKQENAHVRAMTMEADEPVLLVGTDKAPNPVEQLLNAMAACVTTSIVYHAAVRGIKIEEMEAQVEGDLDLRGFLGLSDKVRPGYENVRMNIKVKTDAKNLDELREFNKLSPVLDVMSKGTKIDVRLERI